MTDDSPATHDPAAANAKTVCPACGFVYGALRAARCPLCGEATPAGASTASKAPPFRLATGAPNREIERNFSLGTLMMFVTLVCVLLGAIVAAPGLGIPLAVLSVPALFRASAATSVAVDRGRRPDLGAMIAYFLGSLGLVTLIIVAGAAAFGAACFVSCAFFESKSGLMNAGEGAFILATISAGLIGLTVIVWLFKRTWPKGK
jgi:hypothetical protein